MYTEVWVPKQVRHPYPIVFFHGNGQSGAVWRQTPDGRPGWAYYLVGQGYTVYMVDYPARGRSPYVPGVDGKLGIRTALDLEQIWTAPATSGGNFPRMKKYTQWPSDSPKKGMMGDPVFDNFIKGQMQFVDDQEELAVPAGVALLDQIGKPVILISHSQGGGIGFDVAERAAEADRRHGGDRAGRPANRRCGHRKGGLHARESEFLGPDDDAVQVRSADQ